MKVCDYQHVTTSNIAVLQKLQHIKQYKTISIEKRKIIQGNFKGIQDSRRFNKKGEITKFRKFQAFSRMEKSF